MHGYGLLLTLTAGLAAAVGSGTSHTVSASRRLLDTCWPVGPRTPGFVAEVTLAEQLAEIGVILLMFGSVSSFTSNR